MSASAFACFLFFSRDKTSFMESSSSFSSSLSFLLSSFAFLPLGILGAGLVFPWKNNKKICFYTENTEEPFLTDWGLFVSFRTIEISCISLRRNEYSSYLYSEGRFVAVFVFFFSFFVLRRSAEQRFLLFLLRFFLVLFIVWATKMIPDHVGGKLIVETLDWVDCESILQQLRREIISFRFIFHFSLFPPPFPPHFSLPFPLSFSPSTIN